MVFSQLKDLRSFPVSKSNETDLFKHWNHMGHYQGTVVVGKIPWEMDYYCSNTADDVINLFSQWNCVPR